MTTHTSSMPAPAYLANARATSFWVEVRSDSQTASVHFMRGVSLAIGPAPPSRRETRRARSRRRCSRSTRPPAMPRGPRSGQRRQRRATSCALATAAASPACSRRFDLRGCDALVDAAPDPQDAAGAGWPAGLSEAQRLDVAALVGGAEQGAPLGRVVGVGDSEFCEVVGVEGLAVAGEPGQCSFGGVLPPVICVFVDLFEVVLIHRPDLRSTFISAV